MTRTAGLSDGFMLAFSVSECLWEARSVFGDAGVLFRAIFGALSLICSTGRIDPAANFGAPPLICSTGGIDPAANFVFSAA
ncbi:MAG: hypothetical protein MPK75_10790 [Alphaproteobacteria bacterium]|nr:hypothetical protein [Alphaproteobacteria bacterium]